MDADETSYQMRREDTFGTEEACCLLAVQLSGASLHELLPA